MEDFELYTAEDRLISVLTISITIILVLTIYFLWSFAIARLNIFQTLLGAIFVIGVVGFLMKKQIQ